MIVLLPRRLSRHGRLPRSLRAELTSRIGAPELEPLIAAEARVGIEVLVAPYGLAAGGAHRIIFAPLHRVLFGSPPSTGPRSFQPSTLSAMIIFWISFVPSYSPRIRASRQ